MRKLNLTPRVLRELEVITDFTFERWGEAKSKEYVGALWQRLRWIAENPFLGRVRDDVFSNLRSFKQGSHLIFYVVSDAEVRVLGIPHASADFAAYFDD